MSNDKVKYVPKEEISLEDVLEGNRRKAKALIDELEREEMSQKKETVDDVKRDIKYQNEITNKKKADFIREMKTDLGKEMMKNPSKVKIYEPTLRDKIGNFFKNLFTKF